MNPELTAYEQWMVRSNLQTIRDEGVTVTEQVARLRATGYDRIADAVEHANPIDSDDLTPVRRFFRTATRPTPDTVTVTFTVDEIRALANRTGYVYNRLSGELQRTVSQPDAALWYSAMDKITEAVR